MAFYSKGFIYVTLLQDVNYDGKARSVGDSLWVSTKIGYEWVHNSIAEVPPDYQAIYDEGGIDSLDDIMTETSSLKAAIANLEGGGVDEEAVTLIAQGVMAPLVNPVTAGLTITTPTGAVEVGASTTPAMSWTIGNVANATSARLVKDGATLSTLTLAASGTFTASSASTKTAVGSESYLLEVTDKAGRKINSTTRTINWYLGVYYGSSSSATLDEAGIKALTKELKASMAGTYVFTGGATNYKYICIPASFTTLNMFNNATGFAFPLTQVATVNVTVNGITTSYKVLRSEYQIGDATARN